MLLSARAPAKINLSLHVLGRRPDGYHELESLVAFAGGGDTLSLNVDDALSLRVDGPTAGFAGPSADNLVLRAANHLQERIAGLRVGAFSLTKRLPVAAGVGGGSSDAAAALRLLAQANDLPADHPALFEAARATGADVPVCLAGTARMMRGVGEILGATIALPPTFAVLVNPRIPVETRPVFAELGLRPGENLSAAPHPLVSEGLTFEALLDLLRGTRNDLEPPSRKIAPVISDVIETLRQSPDCRLARMSGSGATCFGLFADCRKAANAARALRSFHPNWWVKPTALR